MPRIAIGLAGERSAREIAAYSRSSLDTPLARDAQVWVAVVKDEGVLLGAFQRAAGLAASGPLFRRGSGGPEARLGSGSVHVAVSMAHPGALAAADAGRIVNRAVRPLLRALSKAVGPAHFFGRDWVAVDHRPVAWAGFAHDTGTRRTLFEAFVAVTTPFTPAGRASFRGRSPATLEGVAGRPVDPARLATAIADRYAEGHEATPFEPPATPDSSTDEDLRADPPWAETCEEAIGLLGAGVDARGVFRVGGDLLVSRDALARLEERVALLAADAPPEEFGRVVDSTLAAPGVALEGVRSLASVRDLVIRARRPSGI